MAILPSLLFNKIEHFQPFYFRLLATTSGDQTARIWNTDDYSLVRELGTANQRWVWDAAFTVDSKFLLTGTSTFNNVVLFKRPS